MTSLPPDRIEAMLATARDALARDVLGLSEGICYLLAQRGVRTFEVFSILAQTYDELGMRDAADNAAREALKIAPGSPDMTALLNRPRAPAPEQSEPRFLLIKAWGFGFWSDVAHVLGCLLICELTGRIPVTDWGANSLFTDGSGEDAFRLFFEPLSSVTVQDLIADGGTVFPKAWEARGLAATPLDWGKGKQALSPLQFLNRSERVVVCDFHAAISEMAAHIPASHPMAGRSVDEIFRYLAARHLVPRADIQAESKAFVDAHLSGPGAVAIHLRGTDKVSEVKELDSLNMALLEAASGFDPSWRIFVMSDDQRWIDRAVKRYGDRVVTTTHRRTTGGVGLHKLGVTGETLGHEVLGREVLIDCCIAMACDRFAGLAFSNVAAMIDIMKNWDSGAVLLVGKKIFLERHIDTYSSALMMKTMGLL